MYECLKISEVKREEKAPYYLSRFLDSERAEVFKVYTSNFPDFEVGTSYDLRFAPSFTDFNFLQDEK